ncbi:hypothetical protein HS7_11670 [Sulfolobales archaeon HS-7]|nr:hypothetical protein HS7_11670 [Sulfolobales archaeon HS-7]
MLILASIAGVMVAIIVFLLYEALKTTTLLHLLLVYFGFFMMIVMFISAFIYLENPSRFSIGVAIAFSNVTMIGFLVYLFDKVRKKSFSGLTTGTLIVLSILAVLSEVTMSLTFGVVYYGVHAFGTLYSSFYYAVNSPWFFYPMMTEMISLFLIEYVSGTTHRELLPLIGIAAFPPTIFDFNQWVYTAVVMSIVFSVLGIISSKDELRLVYVLIGISAILTERWAIPYDVVILISMTVYYFFLLERNPGATLS